MMSSHPIPRFEPRFVPATPTPNDANDMGLDEFADHQSRMERSMDDIKMEERELVIRTTLGLLRRRPRLWRPSAADDANSALATEERWKELAFEVYRCTGQILEPGTSSEILATIRMVFVEVWEYAVSRATTRERMHAVAAKMFGRDPLYPDYAYLAPLFDEVVGEIIEERFRQLSAEPSRRRTRSGEDRPAPSSSRKRRRTDVEPAQTAHEPTEPDEPAEPAPSRAADAKEAETGTSPDPQESSSRPQYMIHEEKKV